MKKVLLITGSSSDIGEAFIESVSSNYDIILAHYRTMNEGLRNIKERLGNKIVLLQAELSDEEQVNNLIAGINEMGYVPTHIVHLAAPAFINQRFSKISWETFQKDSDISLKSIILILQAFLPKMAKKHYGKVVFMLSSVVDGVPTKYCADYVITKYALLGLLKALAAEYAEKGITVNGVSPGMVETKFIQNLPDFVIEQSAQSNPIGRNLVPDDVIPSIGWLLSDGSDCVNGQNILITCGR